MITDHHPAIISPDAFDAVQTERDLSSNIVTDSNGVSTRKSSKYSGIRTIRETHDHEKDRLELINKFEEYKLQDIKAERLGILPSKINYMTFISSSSIIKSFDTLKDCFDICWMNISSNCKS